DWLSFHGRLIVPAPPDFFYDQQLRKYCQYLSVQVGLSPRTVALHEQRTKPFLRWLLQKGKYLKRLSLANVEEYLKNLAECGLSDTTIYGFAHILKSFLRFSERRRWSPPRISWGIVGPRFVRYHNPHRGPNWRSVCALLEAVKGPSRLAKRTRAMCLLLAKY